MQIIRIKVNIVLLLFFFASTIDTGFTTYCGSNCLDFIGTCYSQTYSQSSCIVCATSIYNQSPDVNTGNCILNNQTTIITVDLQSPVLLTGFTGSDLIPYSCGSWSLSGKYTQGSYLSKFYQTPGSHYMVVVRYNILFMGSGWSINDFMTVAIDDNITSFKYGCPNPNSICTTHDCPRIGDIQASHNISNATIVFRSNILNSSGASWGISNLIVALLTCNIQCNSCFGPSPNQCLSCSNNSYLLGNTCVDRCPIMAIPNSNLCVPSCPGGYYSVYVTKTCSPCSFGCSVCNGPLQSNCILDIVQPSLWEQQKQFWIFLIILGCVIIFIGLVFLIIKRKKSKLESNLKDPIIQQTQKQVTQINLSNFITPQRVEEYINDQTVGRSQSSSSNSNDSDDAPKPVKIKRRWRGKQ